MDIERWLRRTKFPMATSGESTWRRATQDFEQFRSSIWGFVVIELVAVTIGAAGFLWRFASSKDSPTVQFLWGALGVAVGALVSCGLLFALNLFLAPYRQRNEERDKAAGDDDRIKILMSPDRHFNSRAQPFITYYNIKLTKSDKRKAIDCTGKLVGRYWEDAAFYDHAKGQDIYLQWDGSDHREVSFTETATLKVVYKRDGEGVSTLAAFDPTKHEQLGTNGTHLLDIQVSGDTVRTQTHRYKLPDFHHGEVESLEDLGEIDTAEGLSRAEVARKISRLSRQSREGRLIKDGIRDSGQAWNPNFETIARDWEKQTYRVLQVEVPAEAERFMVDYVPGGQQAQPGAHIQIANWGNFMDRRLASLAEIIRELSR